MAASKTCDRSRKRRRASRRLWGSRARFIDFDKNGQRPARQPDAAPFSCLPYAPMPPPPPTWRRSSPCSSSSSSFVKAFRLNGLFGGRITTVCNSLLYHRFTQRHVNIVVIHFATDIKIERFYPSAFSAPPASFCSPPSPHILILILILVFRSASAFLSPRLTHISRIRAPDATSLSMSNPQSSS